ncbi:MAG TPA: error-prone DNA polymerase [Steroidobacteraceae bacterium]|nr:error-prone DNA polymerase [Steroidobacteraceae bacterium]
MRLNHMAYAELHCLSNFTFLRGASHPEELVERARQLGYAALALTDECSLAGIVRAHAAARGHGLPLIAGSEFTLTDGPRFVALAASRRGYGELCRLITRGRRHAPKGRYALARSDLDAGLAECLILWLPGAIPRAGEGAWLAERFPGRLWLAVELLTTGGDRARLGQLLTLSARLGIPAVAAGDVHLHQRRRRALQDTLTAVRLKTTVARAGLALHPNGERLLRPLARLAELYPPELLGATVEVAERCRFSLEELRYEYPEEVVPEGVTPAEQLRRLVQEGALRRWPGGAPPAVQALIERELALVAELGYERYFLTVQDIVAFARGRGILCQGRGSAANSAVCYALGITEVDPARMTVLFERFLSRERNEPPDIDVDFEHERREEVIQYLYRKYGRERAALTATVICYRPKSAVRDVGRALGLEPAQVGRLAGAMQWWDGREVEDSRIRDAGFDTGNPLIAKVLALTRELIGFPRHLSQHTGGFVISRGPLEELVPVENAAMPERTVIEWDKDDLDELGLLKVDVLGLGMLTAIRRALALVARRQGRELRLQDIPAEDPGVYDMICRADTVGVFQIESRAQMAMLPRLKPRCYYDLVIEVAIVRPGPIQGQMVHPYLRRRSGAEPVVYPGPEVEGVLSRTLGVPIFQEQVMQLAMVAADFTPGEADQLRRAMAAWKRKGSLGPFEQRLIEGMRARGYDEGFARQVFQQIQGFGEYGFPECIVGETRVVDADSGRWPTIDEIVAGHARLDTTLACDDQLHLRKRKVLAVVASGVKSVWRLRTALGHTIVATAEHPFLTMAGWRPLGKLRVGDPVAAARSIPVSGRRRWPRHEILVLADLIAEGNQGCFSVRVARRERERPVGAVTWARALGIWGRGAREKHLPPEVFELCNGNIALLLARLWEGDGSLSAKGHASYDTASCRLGSEVQHLLLRLGIVARLYRRERSYKGRMIDHHVVTVTGEEPLSRFWRHIGRRFTDPVKRRRSRALAARRKRGRMSLDVIPVEVRAIIRRERDASGLEWREIGQTTGLAMREIQARANGSKGGFRRSVIGRLAAVLHSLDLRRLSGSDVYWDRVVAIDALGSQPTYDVQVDGDHNFVANNLVVHNSHAASFALLVYVSAWLKHHEPAAFCCALLNSQPMGFYAPAQLVRDARTHGVEVRGVDVNASGVESALEDAADGAPALRLGLGLVRGLPAEAAERLVGAREGGHFRGVAELARRAALSRRDLAALARAGALAAIAGHRHRAAWDALGTEPTLPLAPAREGPAGLPLLRAPTEGEDVVADYRSLGLTLARHPVALLRPRLESSGWITAETVAGLPDGAAVATGGIVVTRQRPGAAGGVIFVTLEDETGYVNLVIWSRIADAHRRALLGARLLGVTGRMQREGEVRHVVVETLEDRSALLGGLAAPARNFR